LRLLDFLLTSVHIGTGAVWLGSMAYSLVVVQPRVARVLDPARAEDVYRELAAGNRWRVVALIATLGASGAGLAALHSGRSGPWWVLIGLKALALAGAAGAFWWVSWRGWPRRVFALPAELPPLQAGFRRVALVLLVLVGSGFGLGLVARFLP
jgi:hypothetical protein